MLIDMEEANSLFSSQRSPGLLQIIGIWRATSPEKWIFTSAPRPTDSEVGKNSESQKSAPRESTAEMKAFVRVFSDSEHPSFP